MKKLAVGLAVVSMFFMLSSTPAKAQTIAQLQAQIKVLLAQLAALQGSASCATFTLNLTVGSQGTEVTALQKFLISHNQTIAAGATGYFGAQTQAALAAWQSAQGIGPAVGYFGPITRARVNGMCTMTDDDVNEVDEDEDTNDEDDEDTNDDDDTPDRSDEDLVDILPIPGGSGDACANWNILADSTFFNTKPTFSIHASGMQSQIDPLMRLRSGDHQLSSHVKGCVDEKEVWFSPTDNYDYYSGSEKDTSIALRFHSTVRGETNTGEKRPDVDTDKMMWNLRDRYSGGAVLMGDTVYTAFAFKVPEGFSAPLHDKNFMIFQLWQGTPFSPPISMHVNGDGTGDPKSQTLFLELRKNVGTLEDENGEVQVLSKMEITRGEWVELIIGVRLHESLGSFSLSKRNRDHFELVTKKDGLRTALDPTLSKIRSGVTYHPKDRAQVVFGLYRVRQPADQTVFFDEIRVGPTLESVLLPEPKH